MKSTLFHRYRVTLATASAALLAALIAPFATAASLSPASEALGSSSDPFAAPGAAAAALRTPLTSIGDDGKDMKETKAVAPPEKGSLFNVLLSIDFANEYVTPRGMIVRDRGLTYQPLLLVFINCYKGDGFINSFQIVGGVWNDLGTSSVSIHPPFGSDPKSPWTELDPIGGISIGFAKNFKLEVTYTAFIEQILDIGPSHHLFAKLSYDDSEYFHGFGFHPYFMYWQELDNKATDADVPFAVFGPSPTSGRHAQPGSSFYLEVGITPGYTFKNLGGLTLEAPCRLLLPNNRFYGEYYTSSPTIGIGLFEVGAKATMPLNFMPAHFGHWSAHFGARYMNFVDDNLYNLNTFNAPAQPTRYTWQIYGGLSVFF
jgi:hypothetical protein